MLFTGWGKRHAEQLFKVVALLFTAHVLGMNYVNGFRFQYVLALFSTVWGVGILVEDLRYIKAYYALMLLTFGGLVLLLPDMATDRMELLQNFVIAQVLAYLVISSKIRNQRKTMLYMERIRKLGADLEQKNKALDEAYNDTQSSIRYASGIQRHILPAGDDLSARLGGGYVFFEPCGIVSGDFFWVHEDEDTLWFSVADCTGHGVPGAFVSLLAYTALNRGFERMGTNGPAAVLNDADDYLRRVFAVSTADVTREGMDIALCRLDRPTGRLTFSLAKRPLLAIRADGSLVEFKGDRSSIGTGDMPSSGFSQYEIQLMPSDMVYLFSDGITDQFGGTEDRKFGLVRLRELLKSVHLRPAEEQRQMIVEIFNQWRCNRELTDDVCLLGLRFEEG
jgi:serine phosphatase RsbU (regulator of sigma subunit)